MWIQISKSVQHIYDFVLQVWPTVCLPPCHPGMDSSQPSSQLLFTFSWAPLDTSQWVKYSKCVCVFLCLFFVFLCFSFSEKLSSNCSFCRSVPRPVSNDRHCGHAAGPRRGAGSQHHRVRGSDQRWTKSSGGFFCDFPSWYHAGETSSLKTALQLCYDGFSKVIISQDGSNIVYHAFVLRLDRWFIIIDKWLI